MVVYSAFEGVHDRLVHVPRLLITTRFSPFVRRPALARASPFAGGLLVGGLAGWLLGQQRRVALRGT